MDALPPSLGRFGLRRVLHSGHHQALCLCNDPTTDRSVLVTVVRPADASLRGQWLSAAGALARVNHQHVARVVEAGEDGDLVFLAVERVEGDTLGALIARGDTRAWPLDAALTLGAALCQVLDDLRRQGLAPMDAAPDAVWVATEGRRPLLLDPALVGDERDTHEPPQAYVAPECLAGPLRPESCDVFTMGALLYAVLTGQTPARIVLHPDRTGEQNVGLRRGTLTSLGEWDQAARQIIERAMDERVGHRYPSLNALRQDLEELLARVNPRARSVQVPAAGPAETSPLAQSPRALDDNVQFTVYRPAALDPGRWQTLLAFAHLSERRAEADPDEPDPVEEVARQAAALLGDTSAYRQHTEDGLQSVPRDGELTFVPLVEGVEFNPPRRSFFWTESVHREEFRLRADPAASGRTRRGRMTVYLGSIVLAEIGMTFKVVAGAHAAEHEPHVGESARPYRKIFASYSHRDMAIVREYSQYARAMGDRYLQDVVDLRSGERWEPALETLIRDADVFQLFWSWNALESRYVQQEFAFALGLNRASFIRPVYWDDPLPSRGDLPPDALRALHFEHIPVRAGMAPAVARPTASGAPGTHASAPRQGPRAVAPPASTRPSIPAPSTPPAPAGSSVKKSWKVTLSALAALALIAIMIPTLYNPGSSPDSESARSERPDPVGRVDGMSGPAGAAAGAAGPSTRTPPVPAVATLTVAVRRAAPPTTANPPAPAPGRIPALPRVDVVLRDAGTGEIVGRSIVDAGGNARFQDVPPGTYVVSAVTSEQDAEASAQIVLTERQSGAVSLALRPTRARNGAIGRQSVRPPVR